MSGSLYSYFALTTGNHLKKVQECANTRDPNQIVKYLQEADVGDITKCYFADDMGKTLKPEWVPTIEAPGTMNGLITESPDVIWKSLKAPVIDTLFSFVTQVRTFLRIYPKL